MLVNTDSDSVDFPHEPGCGTSDQGESRTNIYTEKSCLTVTSVPAGVFTSEKQKEAFEQLFKEHGAVASIIYLKSFSRARVIYHQKEEAIQAKETLHGTMFQGNDLGVYFTKIPHIPQLSQSTTLQPPPPVKQFLISPPASPPVNWKPATEHSPVINHDLMAAIAQLQPDEPYEAHQPDKSQPGIMVHWCKDDDSMESREHLLRSLPRHMVQTRKPET